MGIPRVFTCKEQNHTQKERKKAKKKSLEIYCKTDCILQRPNSVIRVAGGKTHTQSRKHHPMKS